MSSDRRGLPADDGRSSGGAPGHHGQPSGGAPGHHDQPSGGAPGHHGQPSGGAHEAMQILGDEYGLPTPTLHPIAGTGGGLKALYRVESGAGTYVLKRYRPDFRSAGDVAALHDLQAYASLRGVPVAPVVLGPDGGWTVRGESGSWVLYRMVEGRHPQPGQMSMAEADTLGETLAQISLQLRNWSTEWPGAEVLEVYPLAERLTLFEELLGHAERGKEELDRICAESLRRRIAGLERFGDLAHRLLAMERQWVHGDPNEGNLIYEPDGPGIRAVIDWDNARQAPRGFDFMYALTSCFPEPGPDRDGYARAYLRRIRPPEGEVELWAPLWAYRQLCDLWPIDLRYLRPEQYDERWRIELPREFGEQEMGRLTAWLLRLTREMAVTEEPGASSKG